MRKLENWIKSYMDFSGFSEAPDKFHYFTAVGVIAGALRRRVWIELPYFDWSPNFYIIFVAPPGIVSKSTTANIGMNLLRRVDGVKFGPDAITWQALATSLAEATELVPMDEDKPATGLDFDAVHMPMSAITCVASEFGTFFNPNDREMVDMLVSLWDGQRGVWSKATKTMGSDMIENPWINIIACTTPAWLSGYFPQYLVGGGFTSRCIFVYGEYKRRLEAYPGLGKEKDVGDLGDVLVHDLEQIAQMKGKMILTKDALEWGTEWYREHYYKQNIRLRTDRFAGYLARKQTHMHKLATVLSASERDDRVITTEHLQAAYAILTGLEEDMPKVFADIGKSQASRNMQALSTYVQSFRKVRMEEVSSILLTSMGSADFDEALKGSIRCGWVEQVVTTEGTFLVSRLDPLPPPVLEIGEEADGEPDASAQRP